MKKVILHRVLFNRSAIDLNWWWSKKPLEMASKPKINIKEEWKKMIAANYGWGEGIESTWFCFHRQTHFSHPCPVHGSKSMWNHLPTPPDLTLYITGNPSNRVDMSPIPVSSSWQGMRSQLYLLIWTLWPVWIHTWWYLGVPKTRNT